MDNTYYPQLDLGNDPTSTFGGRIKYVTPTGAGLKNGSSWENAYDNIQSAINSLSESSTTLSAVYVEEGKYMTTASISMKQGVSLYGGFLNDDKAWSARRPFTHRSIIDVNFSDKYLYSSATFISGQVIDGMTVINKNMGNASAFYSTKKWFLKHCVAENCYSSYRGGGFYLYTTGAVATNCIAIACSSRDYGGGFFLTTGTHAENCVALSCRATSSGGGFYATSSGFLDKCKAILCASRFGGGIQSSS